jgi:hypothetical protein
MSLCVFIHSLYRCANYQTRIIEMKRSQLRGKSANGISENTVALGHCKLE